MKKIITLLVVTLFASTISAQAPQKMSYQAVIRNASNALVANTNIRMRISVLQGTSTGTAVYVETQTATTNQNGLATIEIGTGTIVSGTFASIAWGNNAYYIKTETDPTGGTNYTIVGTSQFLSVPYALFSATSAATVSNPIITSEVFETSFQSIRNQWVDCPDVSITVPVSGQYILTFFGNAFNPNVYQYTPSTIAIDSDIDVRVIIQGQSQDLFSLTACLAQVDSSDITHIAFINMQPTRTSIVNLTQGQVLKIQYNQYTADANIPNGEWYINKSGISIVKIGN